MDEAHGYDPFMEEVLRSLLRFHAMLGGSAIAMTATLPGKMRDGYAEAFQRVGREKGRMGGRKFRLGVGSCNINELRAS
ncbi:MAG: hypothetical protein OXJ64_03065 [Boseongicola sp.]|nr:hypothetical protein [Boseongicola sp.]